MDGAHFLDAVNIVHLWPMHICISTAFRMMGSRKCVTDGQREFEYGMPTCTARGWDIRTLVKVQAWGCSTEAICYKQEQEGH